jgi:hypothetical protein
MNQFSSKSSLQFLTFSSKVDLRFEKSFTMAVKNNRNEILQSFPKNQIRNVYVIYKTNIDNVEEKKVTTPLHMAC